MSPATRQTTGSYPTRRRVLAPETGPLVSGSTPRRTVSRATGAFRPVADDTATTAADVARETARDVAAGTAGPATWPAAPATATAPTRASRTATATQARPTRLVVLVPAYQPDDRLDDLLPRDGGFAVGDAQKLGGQADHRVLVGSPAAVGIGHFPHGGDHADAVFQRDPVLDHAGEAHGVRRLCLDHLGGGAVFGGRVGVEVLARDQDAVDVAPLGVRIAVVGAREPHQQRRDRHVGIVARQR